MTDQPTALGLRIAGDTLAETADQLGLDRTTAHQQLTAELEGTRYAMLGETAALHLLRLDAMTEAVHRTMTGPHRTPADRALAARHLARVHALHTAAATSQTRRLTLQLSAELDHLGGQTGPGRSGSA